MRHSVLFSSVVLSALAATAAYAADVNQLAPPDVASGDKFGASVAANGGTVVGGAPGRSSSAGAVFVFVKSGASWTQQTEIAGSGGAFGTSVGVRGERLVAAALRHGTESGANPRRGSRRSSGARPTKYQPDTHGHPPRTKCARTLHT